MIEKPIIRPATNLDLDAFYKKGSIPMTVKAYAIDYKGKLACVFGRNVGGDLPVIFCDIADWAKTSPILVMKTAKDALKMIVDLKIPMYAIRCVKERNAGKFLKLLGFRNINGTDLYVYEVS